MYRAHMSVVHCIHTLHGVGVGTAYVLSSCTYIGRATVGLEDVEDGELCGMCTCI